MIGQGVIGIIGLVITVIVLTSVFMPVVKGVGTTNWSGAEIALWGTVSLIAIAGFVYGVAGVFGLA